MALKIKSEEKTKQDLIREVEEGYLSLINEPKISGSKLKEQFKQIFHNDRL